MSDYNLLRGCNIPALLSEASFFGLSGLEAALQVTLYFEKNYSTIICIFKEHAKAEELRTAKELSSNKIGDEFQINVGGEVIFHPLGLIYASSNFSN